MSRRVMIQLVAVLLLAVTVIPRPARADEKAAIALLDMMPADYPVAVVVVDFEKLDKSITAMVSRFDPGSDVSMLADFKRDVKIGEWIDFSKPIGISGPTLGGNDQPIIWAVVPGFGDKVKALDGAVEEEGVWKLPFGETDTVYAKVAGGYVVASPGKELLVQALEAKSSIGKAMKERLSLLAGRDVLLHLNIDPVRPMMLGGIAQAATMAPMMAAMVSAQGGTDPAAMTQMFSGLVDAAKEFATQVAYVDITLAIGQDAANATIASGFADGVIKDYLAAQKPATLPFFDTIEDSPFFFAGGYHVPGGASPFFDYMVDKTLGAMAAAAPAPAAVEGQDAAAADAAAKEAAAGMKKSADITKELYRKIEGVHAAMSIDADGMSMSGDYVGKDVTGIMDLLKQSMTDINPALGKLKGATFESVETKSIGDTTVEQFAIKIDPANPAAAIYGPDIKLGMAGANGRVRFCMGNEADMTRTFGSKISKPLATSKYVIEAMANLPKKNNAVMLLDLAGGIAVFGPLMGMPATDAVPPGPPIAISASLSGEPARVDIHVPFRAIERVMQLAAPDQPM